MNNRKKRSFVNIQELHKELHYHPAWYKDQDIFLKILRKQTMNDKDVLEFARIYVKYNHLNKLSELQAYFEFILTKISINDVKKLMDYTQKLYNSN